MQTDFQSKTVEDCLEFITNANEEKSDIHRAIINDEDEYMGTVSLKHIIHGSAEFAITIRKIAMGRGYSKYGMKNMLELELKELKLDSNIGAFRLKMNVQSNSMTRMDISRLK